jgi:hypothetical protein
MGSRPHGVRANKSFFATRRRVFYLLGIQAKLSKTELKIDEHELTDLSKLVKNNLLSPEDRNELVNLLNGMKKIEDMQAKREKLIEIINGRLKKLDEFMEDPSHIWGDVIKNMCYVDHLQQMLNVLLKNHIKKLAILRDGKRKKAKGLSFAQRMFPKFPQSSSFDNRACEALIESKELNKEINRLKNEIGIEHSGIIHLERAVKRKINKIRAA